MIDLGADRMLLRVTHRTTFDYAGEAHDSFNELRLRPVDDDRQSCLRFSLALSPEAATREYGDFYGNTVVYFDLAASHRRLVIEAESEVATVPDEDRPPVPPVPLAEWEKSDERDLQAEFVADSPYVPLGADLWREMRDATEDAPADIWGRVRQLGRRVFRTVAYRPGATGINTRAPDVLRQRAGVCQDFAHLLLGLCRSAGLPVRYVSGYFLNPDRRPGEAEASHAWVEVFVPGHGWAGWDPTHDRPADARYVKVAVGRDYADIRPVSGTYRGAPTRALTVDVRVLRISNSDTAAERPLRST